MDGSLLDKLLKGCVWCLAFTRYMCSVTFEIHGLNPCPGEQGVEEDAAGFANTFSNIPCVSQILGGLSLRLGIPRERLSIPPGSRKRGKNAG